LEKPLFSSFEVSGNSATKSLSYIELLKRYNIHLRHKIFDERRANDLSEAIIGGDGEVLELEDGMLG